MPKDHWKNSDRKAMSLKRRRSSSAKAPTFKKLQNPVTVPVGTCVLVRKEHEGEFKSYVTRKQLSFTHFRAASKAALMFVHKGWVLWISKKAIGYN
jgi:hypothetical protein